MDARDLIPKIPSICRCAHDYISCTGFPSRVAIRADLGYATTNARVFHPPNALKGKAMKQLSILILSTALLVGCTSTTTDPTDTAPKTDTQAATDTAGPEDTGTTSIDLTGGWNSPEDGTELCLQLEQTGSDIAVTLCYIVGDTDQSTCEPGTAGTVSGNELTFGFFGYNGTITISDDGQTLSGMLMNEDKCDPEGCEFEFKRMTDPCDENAVAPMSWD